MSDEKTFQEKIDAYLTGGGPLSQSRSLTDDEPLELIGQQFFSEPPPPVLIKEVVPRGYKADPEVMEYDKRRLSDPDFEAVREKLRQELNEYEAEIADRSYADFVGYYDVAKAALVEERRQREDEEKEARRRIDGIKKYYRDRMESRDPKVRQDAELGFFERFIKI